MQQQILENQKLLSEQFRTNASSSNEDNSIFADSEKGTHTINYNSSTNKVNSSLGLNGKTDELTFLVKQVCNKLDTLNGALLTIAEAIKSGQRC